MLVEALQSAPLATAEEKAMLSGLQKQLPPITSNKQAQVRARHLYSVTVVCAVCMQVGGVSGVYVACVWRPVSVSLQRT